MARIKVSVYVPSELHRRAKYLSFEQGTTIQHVVEDALQKALDPEHRPPTSALRPKEMQVLFAQLRDILQNGNEFLVNTCVSCIRGTFGLLEAERRASQTAVVPIADEAPEHAHTKRKRKSENITTQGLSQTGS